MNFEGLSPSKPPIGPNLPEQRLQLERELQERTAELIAAKEALQREITDRQLMERALGESDAKYRSVVNALGEGVVMIGSDGNILACNPSAEKILGVPANEFVKATMTDPRWRVVDDQGNPLPREKWHMVRVFQTGEAQKNIVIGMYKPDGSLNWLEGHIHPLFRAFESKPYAVVASFLDITDRKNARERLEHSLSLLSATLESTADGILVVDMEGRLTSFNQRFIEMWRIPPSTLNLRDDRRALDYVLDQLKDPQGFLAKVNELYTHPEAESFDVLEFKDGRIFERYSKPQQLGRGVIGRVWSFRDVTKHKRMEEQLRNSQKMEAIGRLADGIAHDFNNIIIEIMGYTDLFLARLKATHTPPMELEEVQKAAQHATSLIRQLLAFSRKQFIQPVILNVNTVVNEMDQLLKRVVGENIELKLRLAEGLWPIKADPSQLELIIMNLTANARDAMPKRGSLLIRTENIPQGDVSPGLDPQMANTHPHIMLLVKDNGTGIPLEIQQQIFEPFFTTKERGKGTGLGLATVQALVTQYQGSISMESTVGQGTVFRIYLPITEASYPTELLPSSLNGTETVLIVEDDEMLRKLLVKVLEKSGYKVFQAPTGDEAIQSLANFPPIQLLVTDVVLQHMSGRELADRLTSLQPHLKVLFMSGYAPDVISRQGILKPGSAFIAKPFTTEKLAQQVRALLDSPRRTAKEH